MSNKCVKVFPSVTNTNIYSSALHSPQLYSLLASFFSLFWVFLPAALLFCLVLTALITIVSSSKQLLSVKISSKPTLHYLLSTTL